MCVNTHIHVHALIHLLQDLRNMIKAKTTYYSRKDVVENKAEKNGCFYFYNYLLFFSISDKRQISSPNYYKQEYYLV